jgi:hypothetical protein
MSDNLPPLPAPYLSAQATSSLLGPNVTEPLFTADQVRAHTADAVAAERERCANLCLSRSANGNYRADTREDCAALILGEFD